MATPQSPPQADLAVNATGDRIGASGDWVLGSAAALHAPASSARVAAGPLTPDASGLKRLDTAGALLLLQILRRSGRALAQHRLEGLRESVAARLRLIDSRSEDRVGPAERRPRPANIRAN